MIPNLTARRSTTIPGNEPVDPPPPYTPTLHPNSQGEKTSQSMAVPLRIDFVGTNIPESWSRDDTIALKPDTTYWQFLAAVRHKLFDNDAYDDKASDV